MCVVSFRRRAVKQSAAALVTACAPGRSRPPAGQSGSSRYRGREIVLDAEEASVRRDRLHRPDRQGRRWFVAHGTLRCRPYHTDQAAQGLLITEELGDADRQACPREQGQGGRARRLAVIMHRMLAETSPLQRCNNLTGGAQQFGQVTTPGLLKPKCLRQDDGSR